METSAAFRIKNCASDCRPENEYRSLISTLSHEVKNQLTLISSSLQLVARECPAVSDLSLWPQIHQELQETICLLKEASALCQTRQMTPEPFSAAAFFKKLSDSFAPLMEERSIQFQIFLDENLRSNIISADTLKLKEAVTNILLNAADAVSERTSSRRIILSADLQSTGLCIHIKDNGPGIPQEYLSTLFEPFVTHKSRGTGLGLAITKNIVEQHGGSITVSTCTAPPDTYTDFFLQIPAL